MFRSSFRIPVAVTLGMFCVMLFAYAQDAVPPNQQGRIAPPEARGHHRKASPDRSAPARILFSIQRGSISENLRACGIHRTDPSSDLHDSAIYFARPMFALVEAAEPLAQLPRWVQHRWPNVTGDGTTHLEVWAKLSTPEYLSYCRDAILKQDRAHALKNPDKEDGVQVLPWPVTNVIAVCRNRVTNEMYSAAQTGMLSGLGEDVRFMYKFDPVTLEKFEKAAEARQIEFTYYYTYVGDTVYRASVEMKANNKLKLAVEETLRSEQLRGEMPIFEGQKNAASRAASMSIERVIRAEDPKLIPFLDSAGIGQRMFTAYQTGEMTLEDLRTMNPGAVQALTAYLIPLLQSIKQSEQNVDMTINTHEDEKTKAREVGGFLSLLSFGLVAGGEDTDRVLDRIEHQTGVRFAKDTVSGFYQPHSIKVYQLREGWEDFNYQESSSIYVPLNEELGYLEDAPIPAEFTLAVAQNYIAMVAPHELPHVNLVGEVILWWGDRNNIPAGYEICDGGLVQTKDAILAGAKPNLVDRFPKGAPADRMLLVDLKTGGNNNLPAHHHGFKLQAAPAGKHQHDTFNITSHEPGGRDDRSSRGVDRHAHDWIKNGHTSENGDHIHDIVGTIGSQSMDSVSGDGEDTSGMNQPAYCELFFLIRVK